MDTARPSIPGLLFLLVGSRRTREIGNKAIPVCAVRNDRPVHGAYNCVSKGRIFGKVFLLRNVRRSSF